MKKLFAIALLASFTAFAAPFKWTCDWPEVKSQTFSLYQGETATFEPTFRVNGHTVTNATIEAVWYQTNGMDQAWWKLDGNTFAPSNDVGAASYRFFVEAKASGDTIYRANGALRMLPSPGFTPNVISFPARALDFANIEVAHAPYYDKAETEAKIVELAPAPGDYANVSNKAMTALQSFTETDPTISSWAKAATKPSYAWNEIASKPTFATVATSGSYNDLSNKPTIPTTAADVGALSINGGTLNGGITVWGDSTFYGNVFSFSDTFKIKFMDAVMTPYFEIFGNDVYLPIGGGTLALTSDIPTTMAWSAITGKPTIPSTASDIGALPISGGTMTGNLVMGYNSLFQINGGGNAKFQFSWGSALDNLIISAYRETSGSYSIRFPTREGLLALTSDIPTSMAWDAITGKPTTISGYGITDALKSDFTSLTNNAAFTSAVAAVSPPTDLTHVEAEIETNRTAIATLSARAYIEVVSADEVYYVFTTNQE